MVVLVDESGMLVSSSQTELDLSMLAAILPIVGRGQAVARIRRRGQPRELTVIPVQAAGETLYVGALGSTARIRRREVATAGAAARRILAA